MNKGRKGYDCSASVLCERYEISMSSSQRGTKLPRGDSNHGLHKMMSFAVKIGHTDDDKNFKSIGIWIGSKLEIETSKKMIPLEYVIEQNPFIK